MLNRWIDVHAHFQMPMTEAERAESWALMKRHDWIGPAPAPWSAEVVLAYMDRVGIQMQMLSFLPKDHDRLRQANDFGAQLVRDHPSRFGLLCALPTDDAAACLREIDRADHELAADGFAVTCCYNGVYLSDATLRPVWAALNTREAAVFAHPDAYGPGTMGRPSALLEVGFETARTVVDMLYAGIFRDFPDFKLILAHCGAALPALSGRLLLLGNEAWVPNPNAISRAEMQRQLSALYLDTAMTGSAHTLYPALAMTTPDHLVYGSDCGVPCTSEATMLANIAQLLGFAGLTAAQIERIGHNALALFPHAAARIEACALTR